MSGIERAMFLMILGMVVAKTLKFLVVVGSVACVIWSAWYLFAMQMGGAK